MTVSNSFQTDSSPCGVAVSRSSSRSKSRARELFAKAAQATHLAQKERRGSSVSAFGKQKIEYLNRAMTYSVGEIEVRFTENPLIASIRCFSGESLAMLHLPWSLFNDKAIENAISPDNWYLVGAISALGLVVSQFHQRAINPEIDQFLIRLARVPNVDEKFIERCNKLLNTYSQMGAPSMVGLHHDVNLIARKIIRLSK